MSYNLPTKSLDGLSMEGAIAARADCRKSAEEWEPAGGHVSTGPSTEHSALIMLFYKRPLTWDNRH